MVVSLLSLCVVISLSRGNIHIHLSVPGKVRQGLIIIQDHTSDSSYQLGEESYSYDYSSPVVEYGAGAGQA